jgi:predicted lactoylglutathione lyase
VTVRRVVVDHVDFVVGDFVAASRQAVDAFHAAAVHAGGQSIAEPRVRPEYSDRYYAAFVRDPDGNNVEAVHHG